MKVLLDFNDKNIVISDEIYLDLLIEFFAIIKMSCNHEQNQ